MKGKLTKAVCAIIAIGAILQYVNGQDCPVYVSDPHECATQCGDELSGWDCCDASFTGDENLHCWLDVWCRFNPNSLACTG